MNALSDFDLLTLSEVAELLHCSKAHVSKAVAGLLGCPAIPAVSLGRRKLCAAQRCFHGSSETSRPRLLL